MNTLTTKEIDTMYGNVVKVITTSTVRYLLVERRFHTNSYSYSLRDADGSPYVLTYLNDCWNLDGMERGMMIPQRQSCFVLAV